MVNANKRLPSVQKETFATIIFIIR